MAYKSHVRHSHHTGDKRGNMTIGSYVGTLLPPGGRPMQWDNVMPGQHARMRAAKRRGIECRHRYTEPFQRRMGFTDITYTLKGYGLAVELKTGNCGYANYAHQALYALEDGLRYTREMSQLIIKAYLK